MLWCRPYRGLWGGGALVVLPSFCPFGALGKGIPRRSTELWPLTGLGGNGNPVVLPGVCPCREDRSPLGMQGSVANAGARLCSYAVRCAGVTINCLSRGEIVSNRFLSNIFLRKRKMIIFASSKLLLYEKNDSIDCRTDAMRGAAFQCRAGRH